MALIQIPDTLKIVRLVESELTSGWDAHPYGEDTQLIGSEFLHSKASAVLQVPSSLCPEEYNFIINPQHPDVNQIKFVECSDFVYPSRLAGKL